MKKGEAVLQKRARGGRSATAGRGGASFIWAAAQPATGVLAAQLQVRLRLWQGCVSLGDQCPHVSWSRLAASPLARTACLRRFGAGLELRGHLVCKREAVLDAPAWQGGNMTREHSLMVAGKRETVLDAPAGAGRKRAAFDTSYVEAGRQEAVLDAPAGAGQE